MKVTLPRGREDIKYDAGAAGPTPRGIDDRYSRKSVIEDVDVLRRPHS